MGCATGKSPLQKVVLARTLRLLADDAIDDSVLLRRLVAGRPVGDGLLTDLSPAGATRRSVLVGVSPELLVARTGIGSPVNLSRDRQPG